MKSALRLVSPALTLSLLAACGSDPAPMMQPPPEMKMVELYSWWSAPSEAGALDKIFAIFERDNPEITIHNAAANQSGTEARAEMRQRRIDNSPPDLFQLNPHDIPGWTRFAPDSSSAPQNTLLPLDELLEASGALPHLPQDLIDVVSIDDGRGRHAYAVPINLHRHNNMFYNKAVFADLGLSPPSSMDEFFAVCDAIQAANAGKPEAQRIAPLALSRQGWIISILFRSVVVGSANQVSPGHGIDYLHSLQWGQADPANDPEMRRAVENMNKIFSCSNQPADDSFGWDSATALLESGRAAMFVHGDWAKGELVAQGAMPGDDFDVVPAFGSDGLFLYNVDGFSMFYDAPHPEEARMMMETMLGVEAQAEFNKVKGSSPARDDVPLDGFDVVATKTILELRSATSVQSVERDATGYDDAVGAALAAMWLSRQEVGFDPSMKSDADVNAVLDVMGGAYPALRAQFVVR